MRLFFGKNVGVSVVLFVCTLGFFSQAAKQKHVCAARTDPNNYCTKRCTRNKDCRRKNKKKQNQKKKKCLCDGKCGLSCVATDRTCVRDPLELSENGIMLFNGKRYSSPRTFRFGDVITYKCNEGFTLSGPSSVTCSATGRWKPWNKGKPSCSKQCPQLSAPQNGRISLTKKGIGGTARFSCFPGYELIGSYRLTCLESLMWSSNVPSCKVLTCEPPQLPENAKMVGDDRKYYQYGDRFRIKCLPGYSIVGSRQIECRGKAFRYLGRTPKCLPKSCGFPGSISNGRRQGSLFTLNKVVRYTCDTGFRLKGNRYLTCQANQKWTGRPPTCERVDCGDPPLLQHGKYNSFGTSYEAIQEVTCDKGFRSSGPTRITCQANGRWSHNVLCQLVTCPLAGLQIENGAYSGSDAGYSCSIKYNCRVAFTCNPGYNQRGTDYTVCTEDGTWSDEAASCEAKDCGPPRVMRHGFSYGDDFTFDNTVTYHCNNGYDLIGHTKTRCNESGVWDNPPPLCSPKDCGDPGKPINGVREVYSFVYRSTVIYSCQKGYELVGHKIRYCNSDGKWTNQLPICNIIRCQEPPKLEHGTIFGLLYTYGESLRFSCNNGYELKGPELITCTESGWNKIWPRCNIVDCGRPFINHGKLIGNTVFGGNMQVKCDAGYVLNNDSDVDNIVCKANGYWTKLPTCSAISCGKPNGLTDTNATLEYQPEYQYKYPEILTFRCKKGQTSSRRSITCMENGKWSGPVPFCYDITCPSQRVNNGNSTNRKFYKVGTTIKYQCREGYRVNGESESECLPSGRWSAKAPWCERVRCPNPKSDGILQKAGSLLVDQEILFTCKEGYNLNGRSKLKCLASGEWDGAYPTCEVSCNKALGMQSGEITSGQILFQNHFGQGDGRLDRTAWCALNKGSMTVKFKALFKLTAILIQGDPWTGQSPSNFRLQYIDSSDGTTFVNYGTIQNKAKSAKEVVQHFLRGEIITHTVKIQLPRFQCARFEFLGCKDFAGKSGYCDPKGLVDQGYPVLKLYRQGNTLTYICKSGHYPDNRRTPKCDDGKFDNKVKCRRDERYNGCYKLDNQFLVKQRTSNNSPSQCIEFCRPTYSYAMVSGEFCYCSEFRISPFYLVPDARCSISCLGEPRIACGGLGVASVYTTRRNPWSRDS